MIVWSLSIKRKKEILKMFDENQTEKEWAEKRQLLSKYLANKPIKKIQKESIEKN